jgi:O-antigen/teichoic acid export membrane protein
MSVKRNLLYSLILVVSRYIFPLIVFPYVSRMIGVSNIGIIGFSDSFINYFVLFSAMGINILGIREIARNKFDKNKLDTVFSELVIIHLLFTFIAIIIYTILIHSLSKLTENIDLFYWGLSKLLFSVFLIDWFYKGIENFKYITIRSIVIQTAYTISVFLFVKDISDYKIYFILTCIVVVVNAVINWAYALLFVRFIINSIKPKRLLRSFILLGLYTLLTSIYTTLNVVYLGFVSTDAEVGYYTTAIKFYYIVLMIFSSFTSVMYPKITTVLENNNNNVDSIKSLIGKSYILTFTFCLPLICCVTLLAPDIIFLYAGAGYEKAALLLTIIMPIIFLVGVSQINVMQILIPINKDFTILKYALIGAICSCLLNVFFVEKFQSIGTSFVLFISESIITLCLLCAVFKYTSFRFPLKLFTRHLLYAIPYLVICLGIKLLYLNSYLTLMCSTILCVIYFYFSQIVLIKNPIISDISEIFSHKLTRK